MSGFTKEDGQMLASKEEQFGLPSGTLTKIWGIESGYGKSMTSPVGAQGHFQFMPATGKSYGLVAPEDFNDLDKSSTAAARYMADNLKRYNGNMELSLAAYNGGPKAVTALAKGKPFAETSGYLAKFFGGAGLPSSKADVGGAPNGVGISGFKSDAATQAPDAVALRMAAEQQSADHGGFLNNAGDLPRATSLGFQTQNSVYNWWQEKGVTDHVDPNFRWTPENTGVALNGIPSDFHDYILQAKSEAEVKDRRARMVETMGKQQELGKMGLGATLTGGLVGGLADLPTLLMFIPGAQGEGLLTAGSRVANAVRMGMVGAGTNVAFDAATAHNRPTAVHEELYMSAAMGLGMGGAFGAAMNPARIAAMRLARENRALSDFGRGESIKAQVKELEPMNYGPGREAFKQKLDAWATAGMPKKYEAPGRDPGILIIGPGERPIDPPRSLGGELKAIVEQPKEGPRAAIAEAPKDAPAVPRDVPVEAPVTPPGPPRTQPWEAKWDTPEYRDVGGFRDRLELPDNVHTVEHLADYVRQFSKNRDIAEVMDRVLKGIDLKKLEFAVIGRGKTPKGKAWEGLGADSSMQNARGAVWTPNNSTGENIRMALADRSIRPTDPNHSGLNEETFVHELVHVVSVYKINARTKGAGLEFTDAKTKAAASGLNTLHKELVAIAKADYGSDWARQLEGRLGINLSNPKELLSYGMTNRAFQEWLRATPVQGKAKLTMWDSFVDTLSSILGLKKGDTDALTRLIELSAPLTREGGTGRIPNTLVSREGFIVDLDDTTAANAAGLHTVFGWGLGLENRLGSASVPEEVRTLASKIFGTTVGYKDHSVVKANAWDDTTKWAESWAVQMRKEAYSAFNAWSLEKGMKPSQKSEFFDDFGNQVSNYIRGVQGDYHPQVVKAGERVRKTLADTVDYINNPLKDEGGMKRGLTEDTVVDANGVKTVVGTLEKNANYLPRKHDINKWNSMVVKYGREGVEGWWANAYKAGRDNVSDAEAAKWAKWYTSAVEEAHANRSQDLLDDQLKGMDKQGLFNSLTAPGRFSEGDAKKIMEDMFPSTASDSGRMNASLKHRNTISETHSEKWTDASGDQQEITLNDFIHSNAFDVVEPYLRRTAGNVALAKHLDIYKVGDIDTAIIGATTNKLGSGMKAGADVAKMRTDLKFAIDRVQGIPQEEFSTLNKSMEMWRSFNVIRLMGGAVWNQATEMSQIVGSMGWKTTLAAVPELRALRRDIATGKAPHDILDHLENTIGGVGSEYIARMEFKAKDDWVRNKGDTAWNRRLDKMDTTGQKLAKGVLDYTGMTPLMIQQKRVHAVALVNHIVNLANDVPGVKGHLSADRLAFLGMSPEEFQGVLRDVKQYTTPTRGQYGETYKMDFAAFVAASPANHSKLMTLVHRESRRVVQENDLASLIPLMGTTLGKTVFQFMNFSMHGWNKSMMHAANHRDWSTVSTMLHGSLFGSMAYMGRTMLSAQGMDAAQKQEFLAKRMSTKQIVANSFGKMAQVSLLPNLYDATLGNVTGTMFSGMRTTSDVSGLASNPTLGAVNGVLSLGKALKNGASSDSQTTQKDVRTWAKLIPLNNVVPISSLLNHIANDYPTSDKQQ
jgi:hypothetical protein